MCLHLARRPADAAVVTLRELACPACRAPLTLVDPLIDTGAAHCPACEVTYRRKGGIWRLLAAGREEAFRTFIAHYETVRVAEGRGLQDPEERHPRRAPGRRHSYEWRIRSRSVKSLVRHVIRP
jgi:uncharacterized protein YbaR (Trm112 family)